MSTCVCGDVEDEHGGDPEYPGSTACNVEDCECVAFEESEDQGDPVDDKDPAERGGPW